VRQQLEPEPGQRDGGTMASIKCGPGVDNACSNACTKPSVSAARTACDPRLETIKVNATGRLQAGNIEFVNTVAVILRHMGKIPECCRNIDEK
jgi:hypothetical protein